MSGTARTCPCWPGEILIPVLAVGLCYGIETDVVQMVAQYIIRLLTARGELDSVLRTAFCHHPENYITLMEYYTPAGARHGALYQKMIHFSSPSA
mgnify:CR=1 FL=1